MKVYAVPDAVPYAEPDYRNFDLNAEMARENQHRADLTQHLVEMGHTGKQTGKIARFPVGDGFAEYMLADGNGRYGRSFLIHLPYGDGYQFQYVGKLSKKDIVENIESNERMAEIFASAAPSA